MNTDTMQPKKKKVLWFRIFLVVFVAFLIIVIATMLLSNLFSTTIVDKIDNITMPDWVKVQLIEIDGNSRRGNKLDDVKDIVIHYVGNPNTTAKQNRGFFANPKSGISSHFLVGLDGEVIQCVPLNEISSASNWRNNDTISIEVCHPDESGKFNDVTYKSLVRLTSWLKDTCKLEKDNIIRHYDVTGKECPRYFVKNEDAWIKFKQDVIDYR